MIHKISTVIDNKCSKFQQYILISEDKDQAKRASILVITVEHILLSHINMNRVNDDRGLDQAGEPTDIDSSKRCK